LENKEIARILEETADLMEIAAQDPFRIRSYRAGAAAVEGHPERVEDILRDRASARGWPRCSRKSWSAEAASGATSC
jgi:DNA polymerase/3'-5' exonuclease PolX